MVIRYVEQAVLATLGIPDTTYPHAEGPKHAADRGPVSRHQDSYAGVFDTVRATRHFIRRPTRIRALYQYC